MKTNEPLSEATPTYGDYEVTYDDIVNFIDTVSQEDIIAVNGMAGLVSRGFRMHYATALKLARKAYADLDIE